MRYMHGMGILSQFSENVTMNNVRCAPTKESGRRMASSADFMHFVGCSGLVKIENCYLDGAHDDNVNIHGIHLRITRQLSPNELVVKFMHHETYGFEAYFAGDEVEFINSKTLNSYAKNRVAKAEELNNFEIKLTLANSLPTNISPDDCLENVTRTPEVQIRNNRFGGTNTRGVLLTTRRKSVIENNIFFRTGMHAILISDDANSWYESGMVTDVTIRGNTFIDCAYKSSPRSIIAIIPENKELAKPVHSNIRIKNNTFKMAPGYLPFTAKSTQNIQFTGNSIENTDSLRNKEIIPITLNACRNVEIKGNKLLNFSDFKVTLENMSAD
jgi:hypothetical protein